MSHIQEEIRRITAELPPHTRLVAVSKYHPESSITEAYEAGQRIFGESHVQELVRKHEALPADIEWHFIGHLQTNKVKYIAPFVSLIHAVDSLKLLREIERQAGKAGRKIPWPAPIATWRRKRANSDSLPTNAAQCWKKANGKTWNT